MFHSLRIRNYRLFFWGSLAGNIGVWMQRTAQAWVVLTITDGNAFALGIVTFLQFVPTLLFSLYAGVIADKFDRVSVLIVTQSLIGVEGIAMSVLDIGGNLHLTQVYVLAAILGVITAFDVPSRQAFVSDLVGSKSVANAVGLNSASFNVARLLGPAIAGLMIGTVGTAPVFVTHALGSAAIVTSLLLIDRSALLSRLRDAATDPRLSDALRFLRENPPIILMIVVAGFMSAIGINSLYVVLPLVATDEFEAGAFGFGILTSALGLGSLGGALFSARSSGIPSARRVFTAAIVFGIAQVIASLMSTFIAFALLLVAVGACFMLFVTSVNTSVQLSTLAQVRGRVMAVYMMFFLGGGAFGAPVLGIVCTMIGPLPTIAVSGGLGVFAGGTGWLLMRYLERRPGTGFTEALT